MGNLRRELDDARQESRRLQQTVNENATNIANSGEKMLRERAGSNEDLGMGGASGDRVPLAEAQEEITQSFEYLENEDDGQMEMNAVGRQADAGGHGTLLRAGVAPCLLPFQHATVVEQVAPEVPVLHAHPHGHILGHLGRRNAIIVGVHFSFR